MVTAATPTENAYKFVCPRAATIQREISSFTPVNHSIFALGWDCESECKYDCMWEAVDFFIRNDVSVPQFHGKWPFVRILGMQEPAAAIASVLNGVVQYRVLRWYQRLFPPTAPFYHLWRLFAFVVMNAWVWSFVFHVRDTQWTERFDYFSAFSLILVQLYSCLVRIVGASPVRKPLVLGVVLGLVFLHHCVSMSLVNFDYGYNMRVNIFFASINVISWFSFCVFMICKGYAYFRWALLFTVWFSASALLETFEFTPIFWFLDSHALWHFSTVPLPYLFYRFILEDTRTLIQSQERSAKTAYHFEMNVDDDTPEVIHDNRTKGE